MLPLPLGLWRQPPCQKKKNRGRSVFQASVATRSPGLTPSPARTCASFWARWASVRQLLRRRIEALATQQAASFGVRAEVDWRDGYAVLVNDADQTELAARVATELFGPGRVTRNGAALTASEDFAFMLEKVPGCFINIGNGVGSEGGCMVHNAGYDFNDRVLSTGASYWVKLAESYLRRA